MTEESIATRVERLLGQLPPGVTLIGAAKTRTAAEVWEATGGGLKAVGHNYVQEASEMRDELERQHPGSSAQLDWHLIGHLQRNKAKQAVELFDMIETIDSVRLGRAVSRHCEAAGKVMPVLVEINSAGEPSKSGVLPEQTESLIRELAELSSLQVRGLMTMGPTAGDPECARPYFRATRGLFDKLRQAALPNVNMQCLSMGMSNSYQIAIEEGANIIRIGTRLFGPR